MPAPEVVITIHGINSRGDWQEETARVLEPHFVCIPHKYDSYRTFGSIKIFISPFFFLIACVLFAMSIMSMVALPLSAGWLVSSGSAMIAVVALVFALIRARKRRRAAVLEFLRTYEKATHRYLAPHVIGHSFGTYLVTQALNRHEVIFDTLILVGCVASRAYPWDSVVPKRVQRVRNETGSKDWVVAIAGFVNRFIKLREFGDAGILGFDPSSPIVHTMNDPRNECPDCKHLPTDKHAPIHNVNLGDYGHSSVLLTAMHSKELWLPVLWGYVPADFRDFVELCQKAHAYEAENRLTDLVQVEQELCERQWAWVRREVGEHASFPEYVKHSLRCRLRTWPTVPVIDVNKASSRAIRLVWCAVHDAIAERDNERELWRTDRIRALRPSIAVQRAIQSLDLS